MSIYLDAGGDLSIGYPADSALSYRDALDHVLLVGVGRIGAGLALDDGGAALFAPPVQY